MFFTVTYMRCACTGTQEQMNTDTQFWRSALLNTACWEHVNTHKHMRTNIHRSFQDKYNWAAALR